MSVAPELFNKGRARSALDVVRKMLFGSLGMETLDPSDCNYRGEYYNSNDSTDFKAAHGFNYHQGPEWIWPVGYYLRACLLFAEDKFSSFEHEKQCQSTTYIELTMSANGMCYQSSNGQHCGDCCNIHVWSNATLLDVRRLNNN